MPSSLDVVIYSDIAFNRSGLVLNEESVMQAILTLLNTRKRERFFDPEYGSILESLLFENLSEFDMYISLVRFKGMIMRNEPRIKDLEFKILGKPDDHSMEVEFGIVTEFGTFMQTLLVRD